MSISYVHHVYSTATFILNFTQILSRANQLLEMIIQNKVKLSVTFMHLRLHRRFCENRRILLLSD